MGRDRGVAYAATLLFVLVGILIWMFELGIPVRTAVVSSAVLCIAVIFVVSWAFLRTPN